MKITPFWIAVWTITVLLFDFLFVYSFEHRGYFAFGGEWAVFMIPFLVWSFKKMMEE